MKITPVFEKLIFSLPAYFVCVLLLSPFLFFCFRLGSLAWPEKFQFFSVFSFTLLQAGVSAFLSLFLAVLGSRGLISLSKKRYYPLIEGLVLSPGFIPPLLLSLSLIQIVEKIMPFPFGLPALIFAQTLTYTGLCTVALSRVLLKTTSDLSEWAYLQGSSSWFFLRALLKTTLLKDIKTLFIFVFIGSFTSLSLPLLIAGSPFFSLEFFIYENLKEPQMWPQALSLIVFQSLFVFLICFWAFSKNFPSDMKLNRRKIYLLPNSFFVFIPFGALFFSVGGLFFLSDGEAFLKLWPLIPFIFSAALNSLILSLGVGLLTLFFLLLMSLSFQNAKLRKFVVSFLPPGVSFMGFTLLVLPFYGLFSVLMKWILGLSLLLFPWVYRFRGERALEQLSSQVEMARFLGAGWVLVFRKILWPQNRNIFFLCAGISSFWACGDFAYSLIVSGAYWNLPLLIYDVFSSYRLDEAVLLGWLLLILSFFVFFFWMGVAFVFSKKFVL